jgi:WD40 repeat protein
MYKCLIVFLLLISMVPANAQEPRLMLPVGHSTLIRSVQFSPDNAKVVTASDDNTAKIWDAGNGRLLVDLKGHVKGINTAKFNTDGNKIVTASSDSTIIIWEVYSGNILLELEGHSAQVTWAEFSTDGKKIVSASMDNTIKIWNAESGELKTTIEENNTLFQSAQFSKDGEKLLTTSFGGVPAILDAQTGKPGVTLKWKYQKGAFACINHDGSIIYTAGNDHISSWDVKTGEMIRELNIPEEQITSVQLSKDEKYLLATFWYGPPRIWNVQTGEFVKEFNVESNPCAAFNSDGKRMVTGSSTGSAQIMDVLTGKKIQDLKGSTNTPQVSVYKSSGLATLSPDGGKFLIVNNIVSFSVWDATTFTHLKSVNIPYNGYSHMEFTPDGKKILVASERDTAYLVDSQTGEVLQRFNGLNVTTETLRLFGADGNKILSLGSDSVARIWDALNGNLLFEIKDNGNPVTMAEMSADGTRILTAHKDATVDIWDGNNGTIIAKLDDYVNGLKIVQFSPDGLKVLTFISNVASVWNAQTGAKVTDFRGHEFVYPMPAVFSPDGKKFIKVIGDFKNESTMIFDIENVDAPILLSSPKNNFSKIEFSLDGQEIITTSNNANLVQVWNTENGKLLKEIPLGVNTVVEDINIKQDKILGSNNSEFKLLSFTTGKELISFYMVDSTDWSVVHSSGLFDASPGAMEKMYWVKGMEIIELSQLKERYYQPGLWKMVMTGKPLRSVEGMGALKMQPEVEVSQPKSGIITVKLTKRDGGYGKVSVFVNNKERIEDARSANFDNTKPTQTLSVNLTPWLIPGFDNTISVKAQSADGFVTGRAITVNTGKASQSQKRKPSFYAIICGTGQYSTPEITLKYPVPDAKAIAEAITLGANNLFGTDSSHVYLLTSPGDNPTTKKNIENTFAEVKKKAKPDDIVLVYLSGHGVTWGGENGDFLYLTNEASSKDADGYKDPVIRQMQTISTKEFTSWLNDIPALKQVMIIDACGSGKAVDNLIAKRDIDASQIKAIDRMKDRTGLYIISGCAADAESYESSIYGQGLLTYAILESMKGAALKENKYVDIYSMLDHAREQVPKFARGLGGIQTPQLLMPRGGSFDIGIINESDKNKIPLAGVKLVFTRTTVLDKDKSRDVLKLSQSINEKLNDLATPLDGKGTIVFIDSDEFPDGCNISGVYQVVNGMIDFNGSILCGQAETPLKFEKLTKEKLLEELMKMVAKMGNEADQVKKALQ